jgi:hypothetical protein
MATPKSAPESVTAPLSAEQAREENAYTLGVQAYQWGMPLCMYGLTTSVGVKADGIFVNEFRKFDTLKTAKERFVVTPNNVTIDAYGAADLTLEPVVVFVPKLRAPRWYLVQIGDYFDEVIHNIGGTKGEQPGVYVITGPDFKGDVPGEMTRISSRTQFAMVAARIFVSGSNDLPKAVEEQKGFRLMPLSAYLRYGLAYKPEAKLPLDTFTSTAPQDLQYFDELGHWMKPFLPISADGEPQITSFHQIGLSVADGFKWKTLDEAAKRGLTRAAKAGAQIVAARWEATGETINGWKYTFAVGRAGYDLGLRAALARYVTGAQVSDQVIYPNTSVDESGEQLNGAHKYVLHFDAGKLPPVSVFWNMAMYGADMFFVANDFGRYSIGSTTEGLKKNADGSLTIPIQKEKPADAANWLPAPTGDFNLTMRFYGPETPVLDGTYRLPPVKRVQSF